MLIYEVGLKSLPQVVFNRTLIIVNAFVENRGIEPLTYAMP